MAGTAGGWPATQSSLRHSSPFRFQETGAGEREASSLADGQDFHEGQSYLERKAELDRQGAVEVRELVGGEVAEVLGYSVSGDSPYLVHDSA